MNGVNILTFNGTPLNREGVFIFPDYDNMTTPDKDQSTVEVPGRDGSLLLKGTRFKNKTIGYHIISKVGIKYYEWVQSLFLSENGYGRLEDSVDADVYRIARCTKITPATVYHDVVKFALTFDAKPARYFKSGEREITITSGQKVYNETMFDALPLFEVTGSGTLTVGNKSFTCKKSMTIDSEAQDCYGPNGENLNDQITINGADFPALKPGENSITYTGFSKVTMKARWWTL